MTADKDAHTWADRVAQRNKQIRAAGQWRAVRNLDSLGPNGSLVDAGPAPQQTTVVSFAGNDYLGLSAHPAVIAAAHIALDRWGAGTGASRLVTGNRPIHEELEAALANWKHTERAVLFPTGFATNLGVLTALGTADTTIFSDELNHASIIDGCRLARAHTTIYPHGDLDALAALLTQHHTDSPGRPAIVVSDTVFSMDGDAADVPALAALCGDHGALLVLDEAHAVLGPDPDPSVFAGVDVVRVGTLSKTLGALGGFAATSAAIADHLVNVARSYIFTTALSPADAAAGLAALHIVRSPEGDTLRTTLRGYVDRLIIDHPSPIIPVILGDEGRAVAASEALLAEGLLVPAIRPPTVAPGTSRLRVTLSAAHTPDQVDHLVTALKAIRDHE